jgi:predicted AlkP superfamily phosphohydrolase/phosphomutase
MGTKRPFKAVRFVLVAVVSTCFVAAGVGGCGGSKDDADDVPVTNADEFRTAPADAAPALDEIHFDDWDAFLSSDERTRATPRQVVVIGIDGAPWHYIDKLIEEGHLPNLKRLKKEGAYGTLLSTRGYVTPPAWTAMFTGYLPGKTGIYSFGEWVRETGAASKAGLKVGMFNVPMTYPVHPVNGAVVAGMMTPIKKEAPIRVRPVTDERLKKWYKPYPGIKDYSQPTYATVADSLNLFLLVLHDTTDDKTLNYDRVSVRILSRAAMDAESPDLGVFTFTFGSYSQWLPVRYRSEGKAEPAWSRLMINIDERRGFFAGNSQTVFPIDAVYTHPEELQDALADRFGFYLPTKYLRYDVVPALTEDMADYAEFFYGLDDWDLYHFVFTQPDNMHHEVGFAPPASRVYGTIDKAIGEIMEQLPAGSTLIVASDHGNGQFKWGVDLNAFFTDLKLLEWETPRQIDHENTLVFHNLWHLYFNHDKITREELAKRGIDVPAGKDPYEYLMEYVTEAGRRLRAPIGLRDYPVEFRRVTDRTEEDEPDMWVVGTYGDYLCDYWNVTKPHPQAVRVVEGPDQYWHTREGIYLFWGDDIRHGYDAGLKAIQDIGPTILYLAGLPVAPDMDGRVMSDIFESKFVENRPLFVNAGYRDIPKEAVLDPEQRDELEKKLKSLGYIR